MIVLKGLIKQKHFVEILDYYDKLLKINNISKKKEPRIRGAERLGKAFRHTDWRTFGRGQEID